jgi:thiamine-phosphate pyrophosphorylase
MERSQVIRILDANLNRAGEALREIEDAARFGLNSAALSQRTKELRHRLAAAPGLLGLSRHDLAASRDSESDVGRPEQNVVVTGRGSSLDVVTAAFKRLQQSLRSLEEYSKLLNSGQEPGFEALRYASYALEKAVLGRFLPAQKLQDARLYLMLIGSVLKGEDHESVLKAAIDGGVQVVQLREKEKTDREFLMLAEPLRRVCDENGVLCLINDRPQIALALDADGVHVGNDDLPPRAARNVLGPGKVVGVTAHSLEEALAGQEGGADYLGFGTMFPTATKAGLPIRGIQEYARLGDRIEIPIFAVGGISLANLSQLLDIGIRRVAVATAILQAEDVAAAAREFRKRLSERV